MRDRLPGWLIPVLLLLTALSVHANVLIEQEQFSGAKRYSPGFGQSFLLPAGATIGAIDLRIPLLQRNGESIVVKLWEATGDPDSRTFLRKGNSPIATGFLEEEELDSEIKWYTIEFDEIFTNTTQEPIYMVFEVGFPRTSIIRLNYFGFANNNPYEGGHAVYWSSNAYQRFEGEDLSFRILGPILPTTGQVIIAQEMITDKADYGSGFGQSFLLPAGVTVGAIDLHIGFAGSGGGSAMLRLWKATGAPGSHFQRIGTEPIATGMLDRENIGGATGWQTIILDSSFENNSTQPIYLVFEVELLTYGSNGYNDYSLSKQDPYEDGHLVFWDGFEYGIGDGQDLAFRVRGNLEVTPLAGLQVTVSPSSQLVTIIVPESVPGFIYTCYDSPNLETWGQLWSPKSGNGNSLTWHIQHVTGLPKQNFFKVETSIEP